jgi:hypothetical protein
MIAPYVEGDGEGSPSRWSTSTSGWRKQKYEKNEKGNWVKKDS